LADVELTGIVADDDVVLDCPEIPLDTNGSECSLSGDKAKGEVFRPFSLPGDGVRAWNARVVIKRTCERH